MVQRGSLRAKYIHISIILIHILKWYAIKYILYLYTLKLYWRKFIELQIYIREKSYINNQSSDFKNLVKQEQNKHNEIINNKDKRRKQWNWKQKNNKANNTKVFSKH